VPGTNLTRTEARERAGLVSVSSYDIELDLTTGEETFASTTTVRFSCSDPGASTFIDLIAPRVRSVRLNGRDLDPADVADGARIRLDDLAAENELTVVADASYMNTGEGLHRFVDPVDKEVYLYSQFEVSDARRVFTCFDQPDLKATFAFTVTGPKHWRVISNSPTPQPEVLDATGSAVWRFSPTPRLSTYVTAIIAGPYEGATGELTSSDGRTVPLGVFCRASLAQHLDADELMHITRQGFGHYESLFAVPYPFEKYDQVFVPEFNAGAMENAGAVTFLEGYVFRSKVPEAMVERRALTVLHELAHMWFGDLVTMRWWDDLWLNESFAEYTSTLCMVESTRWDRAWTTFSSMEKSWAYRQDQLPSTHPIVADIRDLEDVEVNFDGITYAKGASVLKQLVAYVGREEFDEGVRRYFAKHAWGNTELGDLLAELEATSGRDLSSWSALWLQKAGITTLRPRVESADGVLTALAVEQETPAEHPVQRPHRLAVSGYDVGASGRMERSWRVELDVDGPSTPVAEAVGKPVPDLLLVNDDDLAYAKIRLDEGSMATAVKHLGAFDDSLPRALVWGAAWDMTRDAEMAPRDFVELVCENIAVETDSSVVLTVLRQLATTVKVYVHPDHRQAVSDDVATRLMGLAEAAEAGGDLQLQLVKAAAAFARTEDQLARLQALLDGSRPLPGLEIDTDLRWELLVALVAGGAAGEDAIDAELERDDTATGRRAAAGARAAIPTAESKEKVWLQVVESDDLPNAVQATVIAGFMRVHDTALVEPYVDRYFDALQPVWTSRTNEMAQQIVIGLYPTVLADQALLDKTDAWLASSGVELPALKRLTVENRDGIRRALAAQERDRG
jgi:aminopeptidase N